MQATFGTSISSFLAVWMIYLAMAVLGENAPHVLVGRNQTFHQHVTLAFADHLYGDANAVHIHRLGNDLETRHVDAFRLADLFDLLRITDNGYVHNTCFDRIIHGFKRVRILSVSYDEPAFASRLGFGDEFV